MATSDLCDALKKHAIATSLHSSRSSLQDHPMTSSNSNDVSPQMIDAASEKKICDAVLKRVDDASNDVQAIAVKTLGVLVTCVHEDQVVAIAERLSTLVLDEDKSALRDVYAIGLRTLVKTVPMNMGDIVSSRLAAGLLDGIRNYSPRILSKQQSQEATTDAKMKAKSRVAEDITLACLEILTELLARFGALSFITRQHLDLLGVTLRQLACDSELVRKRAGQTIGSLAVVISDQLLGRLVETLLSQIDKSDGVGKSGKRKSRRIMNRNEEEVAREGALMDCKPKDTRALIRTMCNVAGLVGHRLGQEQIDRLVPIFSRFCDPADADSGDDNDNSEDNDEMADSDGEDEGAMALANELREACLSGFESFVLRKPVEIQPHLSSIIHSALAYMRHDPNYSYGDENDEDGNGSGDDENEEDYDMDEEEEEYDEDEFGDDSDDNDDSWKVRRSAIRTLTAVVKTSAKDPSKLWADEYTWRKNKKLTTTVAGALVKRFKERDENCRVDIVECFTHLLTNTIKAANRGDIVLKTPDSMDVTGDSAQVIIDLRTKFVPIIIKGCEKQLSAKRAGNRTKSAALSLLSALCSAPGGIGDSKEIRVLFDHIKSILSDVASATHATNKTLKLDCLQCVHVIITCPNHAPEDIKNCTLEILLAELCNTLQENWYKITSETLRVLAEVPKLLVLANATAVEKENAAKALYVAIEPRLAVHDADQEVKECSLMASASLLSNLHLDEDSRERLLSLILLRLKNETTRISAIKTISAIVKNGVDMSTVINDVITELSSLLRQNSRSVKQSALQCLDTAVTSRPAGLDVCIFGLVVKELSNVIVDSDLHISHLSLKVCHSILDMGVSSVSEIKEFLLPSLLNMSKSSLLQDKALDSLLLVLEKLVSSNAVVFQDVLVALKAGLPILHEGQVHGGGVRLSIANIAQCIAAITAAASADERNAVVEDLLSSLESLGKAQSTDTSPSIQLALRVAGDLGRRLSLGAMDGVAERLQNIYMAMFASDFEDIKNSAAYGLGRASVCSKTEFLPKILCALEENDQKKQYLLLSGLRELIYCHQQGFGGDIAPSIEQILPHLNNHLADREEGVRTMVADCMGCLVCLEPAVILPQLQKLVADYSGGENPTICTTVLTSVKYAIAGKCDAEQLLKFMPTFLELLKEEDISVKNACLLMIYSAVHHKPQLVLSFMEATLVPALYELAQLKQERTVDLGPFKQKVDDALPVRKAALSIFSTCLDKCPEAIDIPGFMPILAKALADKEDIQLQAHQILISTSSRYPDAAAAAVESFVAPLEKTMNKSTGTKKGAELERATEWVKSAVRVMIVLSRVTDAMNCSQFADLVARIRKADKFKTMLEELDDSGL